MIEAPQTPEDWQNAVDAADALLTLDSARMYGLVTGGPKVNVEQCELILRTGKRLGFTPTPDATERFARELATASKHERKRFSLSWEMGHTQTSGKRQR